MKSISIENTTLCGADCIMCPRHTYKYKPRQMPMELFRAIVEQISSLRPERIFLGGYGDPLMDKFFLERCEYIHFQLPNTAICTTTTGHLLDNNMLNVVCQNVRELLISMYGYSKEVYESIHRGSLVFEKVKKNIDALLSRKDRPYVVMKYLVFDNNQKEMELWKEYYIHKCDRIDIWKPHNFGGVYSVQNAKSIQKGTCFRVVECSDLCIRVNGDVSVCCMDFNHELVIGNLLEEPLSMIMEGKRLEKLKILNDEEKLYTLPSCKYCDQLTNREGALIYTSGGMSVGKISYMADDDLK